MAADLSVFILALLANERDALLALLEDSGELSQPLRSIKDQLANPLIAHKQEYAA